MSGKIITRVRARAAFAEAVKHYERGDLWSAGRMARKYSDNMRLPPTWATSRTLLRRVRAASTQGRAVSSQTLLMKVDPKTGIQTPYVNRTVEPADPISRFFRWVFRL